MCEWESRIYICKSNPGDSFFHWNLEWDSVWRCGLTSVQGPVGLLDTRSLCPPFFLFKIFMYLAALGWSMWDLFPDKGSNPGPLLVTMWSQPLDHEGSLLLHFFDDRKLRSFRLHGLPWVLMGRFKQLFTGEGHGCKTREKPRNLRVALSQEPDSPSRDAQNIFELFCRYENPLWVGELDG